MKRMSGWAVAALCAVGFAILFVALGGISHGYSPRSVAFLAVSGFLLGAIAAPELEPKAFRHPAVWQVFFGALGGVVLCAAMSLSAEANVAGAIIGGLLGFLAPYWVKHLQVP